MLNSTENPFILMKVQGYPCQKVCGAQLTEVEITTGADIPLEEGVNSAIEGTIKPDGTTSNQRVQMRYCYYQRKDYAKFASYELVEIPMKAHKAERECQNRRGHLASIHNQKENEDVRKLVGSGSKAWIGLKRKTVRNRPWVWTDGTELDFGDWEPDVTDNENYVSISGDDGSWEAKDKNPKLPFVCKVIKDCP
ncbi:unnamed protein product [Porites evermanni]|uniref:C-type lectin domain-containing protein n=1 Tax=Porites evermanni TaxID=104178 RepID=A0ABN8M310_9CNID|nr:unnamed protein product [Porites evermanni]